MLLRKNRQTLRGLSHQEKVKKLQKLTRVPLQNLNTNIAQSDFEQDDISVPICLKFLSKADQTTQTQHPERHKSKGRVFDQQQINRTIRTMTKELYTLQLEKQKSPVHISKRHQRTVSIFSIQGLQQESLGGQNKTVASKQTLEQFYSTSKNQISTVNPSLKELSEISAKLDNFQNQNVPNRQNHQGKKQIHQRHTQPIISTNPKNEPNKNVFPPKLDLTKKKDDTQSQISKRFSRSKRDSDQLNQLKNQKKLKFNRSNQKKRHLNRATDKENDANIYTTKKTLLTERLSFETIPTHENLENEFKKRKNIGKNFITFQNRNLLKEVSFREVQEEEKNTFREGLKNSLKNALMEYEAISKNQAFKKLQEGKVDEILQNARGKDFLVQLYTRYRESIELLKSLQ